jgi:hypothetical protein
MSDTPTPEDENSTEDELLDLIDETDEDEEDDDTELGDDDTDSEK